MTPSTNEIRSHLERLGYRVEPYGRRWWVYSGETRVMLATPAQAWHWLKGTGQVEVPNEEDGVGRDYRVGA